MMKTAVMISIQPKWCGLIASGRKTIELRKTMPKLKTPFKCYIYCTNGKSNDPNNLLEIHSPDGKIRKANGKVIGEFICDRTFPINVFNNGTIQDYMFNNLELSCVPYDDIAFYIGNGCRGAGWHIYDLVIYDNPKKVSDFHRPCTMECLGFCGSNCTETITRPPQSWCYVEELAEDGDTNG